MLVYGGVTYIHNFATKNTSKKCTIRFMLTSMPDRNRKVSSHQRRFTDTVTEEVMMSLSSAFRVRREKGETTRRPTQNWTPAPILRPVSVFCYDSHLTVCCEGSSCSVRDIPH